MFATFRLIFRWFLRTAAAAVLFAIGLAGWAFVVEPNRLIVREVEVVPPDWQGPDLRVALLSDLHIGSPWNGLDRLTELVNQTNAQKPDLILLLGDYDINRIWRGHKIDEPEWTPILGMLNAPLGSFAVLGNHDWWNDPEDIRSHLEENGISVLENRALPLDGGGFWLAGIGDSVTSHDDMRASLRGVPKSANVLVMTHAPDLFAGLDPRVDLMVAGHTHGGQVAFPFLGAPAYREPYLHGAYSRGRQRLHVTSGLGMSVYPVRFGVPPEIVMLTVKGVKRPS